MLSTLGLSIAFTLGFASAWGGKTVDAPFSVPFNDLASSVYCPRGLSNAPGGIVFLIHGTGCDANQTWTYTPYNVYLPYASPGFDVCWVQFPNHALSDAQISAEYIAYNIPLLAKKSSTGKVALIGHSQGGGLNIQWALAFWPSIRQYVSDYIALAGDFHGTTFVSSKCTKSACHGAILQQGPTSNYLAAQHTLGGKALVHTTSIYTILDDLVHPETRGTDATSYLPGAENLLLQDDKLCGPLHLVEHFGMTMDAAAYYLAYDALTHDGPASVSRFKIEYCLGLMNNTLLTPKYALAWAKSVAVDLYRLEAPAPGDVTEEPPLKSYVCERAAQLTGCPKSGRKIQPPGDEL